MRHFILLSLVGIYLMLACACSKSQNSTPNPVIPPSGPKVTTVGNTTDYNGYVVKTLGVSRIVLAVDDNMNLTVADIYGGGNRVVLKAGTGNIMEVPITPGFAVNPDEVTSSPDGYVSDSDQEIDNGNQPDTSSYKGMVIKLRGFDKSVTGYNQINLVMSKYIWSPDGSSAGYHNNVTYLKIKKASGAKNADYGGAFIKKLFTGNIKVTNVEIAKPKSENPYITVDQIVSAGISVYGVSIKAPYTVKLDNPNFITFFGGPTAGFYMVKPKVEWVNADNGTVTSAGDNQTYYAKFSNIKKGGLDQIVDPVDSISKVYLRISGLDPKICGFNQIRLFLADDGTRDGSLQLIINEKQTTAPTLSFIKNNFLAPGLFLSSVRPYWPHY